MKLLIKLLIAAAILGPLIYMDARVLIAVAAPLVAIIFTSDIMNFFSAAVQFLRKQAYAGDARVFRYGYNQIRMITQHNRTWFAAKPVCDALGYADVLHAIRHYATTTDHSLHGVKKEAFLSETGVRRLAELSRHADAKSFLRWFEREVVAALEIERRGVQTAEPPNATKGGTGNTRGNQEPGRGNGSNHV